MRTRLPELVELEHVIETGASQLSARVVCRVSVGTHTLPVYVITLGNPDPDIPAIGFFGGVHGLERIGASSSPFMSRRDGIPWGKGGGLYFHHGLG
jgi:hypothetical protein